MKFVLFVIAAFAAIESINCMRVDDSSELMHQLNIKMIRDNIRQRHALQELETKIDDICPGYGSHLENVTMEIQSCLLEVDENEETMCSMAKNHFERCISPLTQMFEECLPTQSRTIPSMVIKMLVAGTKYICKTDGEHIFELGNPCIRSTNLKTQRCVRRLTSKMQEFGRRKQYPTVQDMCELFENIRPCLQSHLNTACGNPVTRDSYLSMFDELVSVCRSYRINEIEFDNGLKQEVLQA